MARDMTVISSVTSASSSAGAGITLSSAGVSDPNDS